MGRRPRWLRPLAHRLISAFGPRPPAARLAAFLMEDARFRCACDRDGLSLAHPSRLPAVMCPAPGAPTSWTVPAITTPADLADRLGLAPAELAWFADRQGRECRAADGPLRHYRYHWRPKPSGSARLIEAPKPRLRAIQRQILDEVLAHVPPHEAAHGFRPGRSARTFAEPHVGRRVVLKLDLRDFFPSIQSARVAALFLTIGYPEAVARLLTGLCTNSVPADVWNASPSPASAGPDAWRARRLYRQAHLPQGAPTSPALANLGARRLDTRLTGLSEAANARYTRYADDLVFSGEEELERSIARFQVHVGAIALEEGFVINTRKTRVMRRGVRQRVAGVVVNEHVNVARDEFDALKATLHNCVKDGPLTQNRTGHDDFRAHLAGRISHVGMLNPARGRRLLEQFARIAW